MLLRTTGLRIIEISGALGYENPSKFSEAFSAFYGLTPREYRITSVRRIRVEAEHLPPL